MIIAYDKLDGSGLSLRTSNGGRIALDGPEVEALCAMLPGLFPGHFDRPGPARTMPIVLTLNGPTPDILHTLADLERRKFSVLGIEPAIVCARDEASSE